MSGFGNGEKGDTTVETTILGAGALGLTLALRLALQGEKVIVVERGAQPGGLAAGFRIGDVTLEKFYHHLFQSDHDIITLLNDVGLGQDLIWDAPDTSMLIGGRPHELNSVATVLKFAPLPIWDRLRLGAGIGFLKLWPKYQTLENQNASTWLRRWMGANVYDTVWRPQLEGKFGAYAADVSLAWMWARLHYRTTKLGYLRGGFQRLYDRLAEVIISLGGELIFDTTVTSIREAKGGKVRVTTSGGELITQRVVSTLPTRVTMELLPTLPTFQRRYEWGHALGAHCLILALDRQLMEKVYWLSVCDPGYPFLAVVEHTNFIPPAEYGGRHLVYLGNYLPMDHPLFQQNKEGALEAFLPALRRINPAFNRAWITESWMFSAPYAQPVVTPDFHNHIPPHTTPLPNVYMANMFQVYPQDRGQNYAVAMANRLADTLIAQGE